MKILHRISLLLCIALIFGLYLLSNRKIPNSTAQEDEHYLRVFDLTPFLDNPLEFEARFGENVVFFIESSSSGRLGAREVCSVEALTFLSPNVKIFIIIANDVRQISLTKNPALTELLSVAQNLIIATVNSVQVVKGTPLEAISTTRFLETGSPVEHLSDFLRLGLLWKLGGVYMDLDLLTFRNIDEILNLKNFLTADTKDKINSCMMGFQRNHPFLKNIMAVVDKTYEPLDYSTVPRTLNVATVTTFRVSVEEAIKRGRIGDVHFLNYTVISPVTYDNHLMLYDELKGVLTEFMTKNSFGVHLWNSMGNIYKLKKNSTAPYAVIARKFCPRSFEKAEDLF